MIRPYILKETNWKDIQNHQYELAVLPWGATEAHNYHLPYGTDVYEGDAIAAESARIAWEKEGEGCSVANHTFWGQYRAKRPLPGHEHIPKHPDGYS